MPDDGSGPQNEDPDPPEDASRDEFSHLLLRLKNVVKRSHGHLLVVKKK